MLYNVVMMKRVLAIDLGGTKIAAGIIGANGKVLAIETALTPRGDITATKACITSLATKVLEKGGGADAIGLALPGIVDQKHGILIRSPSSGLLNIPFGEILKNIFNLPIYADNDVNACAWGEYKFGIAAKYGSLFWMTISTGIGGALLVDSKIFCGANGMAGEIGHLIVNHCDGALCSCGNHGCLEAEAAGPAWRRLALQFLEEGRQSSLIHIDQDALDAAAIAQAARSGDKLAMEIIEHIGKMLARGIAAIENLFDPEVIVIGGGVAKSLDLLLPIIEKELPSLILTEPQRKIEIKMSSLGYNAALLGAAALAFFPY